MIAVKADHYTALESDEHGLGLIVKGTPGQIGMMLAQMRELGETTASVLTDAGFVSVSLAVAWRLREVKRADA